jgi:type VI secretion system protein VasD
MARPNPTHSGRNSQRSHAARLLLLAVTGALAACSLLPGGSETPAPLKLTIAAAARLNPDDLGQSLPTAVRVLQLASAGKATAAEMLELVRDPKELLGDDLLGIEEILVQPGARVERTIAREKGARAVLLVGLFRRPAGAAWKQLVELPSASRTSNVSVVVEEYRIERR